jgi:excisionase family DNA binding protein
MMPQAKQQRDKKLTISQAGRRLGVHASTIRRYLRRGILQGYQYVKFGQIRIKESEIERFEAETDYQEKK